MFICIYVVYLHHKTIKQVMKNLSLQLQSIKLNPNQKTALFIFVLVTFIFFCIYNTPPRYR